MSDLLPLATKAELAEAKADLIKWMVGVSFAQAATLIGALFAFLKLFPGGNRDPGPCWRMS